eukprot:GGOE01013334.1.p1 GENE.GGOE01013334.1~~GGOE01013334.1.p1  ORF type:complete len:710 (-),score=241.62 GGOE01013334.1:918-2837(-)
MHNTFHANEGDVSPCRPIDFPEGCASRELDVASWDERRGSPLYLDHITYEVDYVVPNTTKNPLAKKVMAHRVILQDINTHVRPGELVAIMGSSGSGKTTTLNVMACRIKPTSGELYLSGQLASGIKEVHRRIAYVMQDDILMVSLTVKESLKFAASLKLSHLGKAEREERITTVLEELGLSHVQNTIVGNTNQRGISGGERKRTAIAVELLSRPAILFLDEPTSGLDSFTAESVVNTCKTLANHGHTVVATIHQPNSDIFRMFNKVMFLAKGQVVYNGPGANTIRYFQELGYDCPQYTNPADYIMKLLRLDVGKDGDTVADLRKDLGDKRSDEFIAEWRLREAEYLTPMDPPSELDPTLPVANWRMQLRALFWRSFLNMARNKMLFRVRLGQAVFFGVFVGCIFLRLGFDQAAYQARLGAIFFTLMNQTMPSLMGIVHTFPAEKAVLNREHANGMYGIFPYYFSKFSSELPFQILLPVIFSSIFYWLVNLNPGVGQFFIFMGIIILLNMTASSLGIWISALAPSISVALALSPAVMLPLVLFAGYFSPGSAMPDWCAWMKYVTFYYYAFGAAVKNEFTGETFTCSSPPCYLTGEAVLERYSFQDVSIWANCIVVLSFCIAFQIMGFISLWWVCRKSVSQ